MNWEFFLADPKKWALVVIPLILWISAQIIKFVLYSSKHEFNWKYLFEYGHMPSSHTACVTALIFTAGYYEGIDSPVFAVAFSLGTLIIYDAIKLRTYVGEYGKTLNRLARETGKKKYPQVKERVGHTFSEVFSGALLGIVGAFILIQVFKIIS
jgi:uncharacterized protein